MLKKRIFISVCIIFLTAAALFFMACKEAKKLRRDPVVLMNKYYHFKNIDPEIARKTLLVILNQHKKYTPAILEYKEWQRNNTPIQPTQDSMPINHQAMVSSLPNFQDNATTQAFTLSVINLPFKSTLRLYQAPEPYQSSSNNHHGSCLEKNLAAPHRSIKKLMTSDINNIQYLKEAGYNAILHNDLLKAIDYFTHAYHLSQQPEIAMQLGYLYSQLNDRKTAFQYFTLASRSQSAGLSLSANNALTTLVGQQTKSLAPPFFSEVFFNPFTESRFGLTILPFIWRLGIEQNNHVLSKEYIFFRRTQDNRSQNLGEISQIYEDNVQITGIGGQLRPLTRIPLVGFVEVGAAYDLVYRNRDRWRWDFRSGLMYYQEFGKRPLFFDAVKFARGYYSDWYGDATYFTRYSNLIGLIRTHQGIRLLEWHSSMLNLYMTGRVIEDTQRQFYNNIAEIGPGLSIVPSNRLNLQIRFEHIKGVYLPAGASVNPYGKYYTNNILQLMFYAKF